MLVQAQNKEQINYDNGLKYEDIARKILEKKFTIEDRASWAKYNSGKEYAMDWVIEDLNVAVEYKFKSVSSYITINHDHITKYIKYLDNHPELCGGLYWVQDNKNMTEYRIDIRRILSLYNEGKVIRKRNYSTRKHYESGYYYEIPLEYFENITDKPYSISSCSRL